MFYCWLSFVENDISYIMILDEHIVIICSLDKQASSEISCPLGGERGGAHSDSGACSVTTGSFPQMWHAK